MCGYLYRGPLRILSLAASLSCACPRTPRSLLPPWCSFVSLISTALHSGHRAVRLRACSCGPFSSGPLVVCVRACVFAVFHCNRTRPPARTRLSAARASLRSGLLSLGAVPWITFLRFHVCGHRSLPGSLWPASHCSVAAASPAYWVQRRLRVPRSRISSALICCLGLCVRALFTLTVFCCLTFSAAASPRAPSPFAGA